ncbi:hypothetical protein F4678DRAFT_196145 [Xylaria arbuscula]|nr:hypothetical protein F4678DRAFT_196145 [Xylaria arbuscula]
MRRHNLAVVLVVGFLVRQPKAAAGQMASPLAAIAMLDRSDPSRISQLLQGLRFLATNIPVLTKFPILCLGYYRYTMTELLGAPNSPTNSFIPCRSLACVAVLLLPL